MTKKSMVAFLSTVLLTSTAVRGQVTDIKFMPVDNSRGGPTLAEFVTTDLNITFNSVFKFVAIIAELSNGTIYQDVAGGTTPPNANLFSLVPSLEFDTFIALGSTTQGGPYGEPHVFGGAIDIDLGADPAPIFTDSVLSLAWGITGGAAPILNKADFTRVQ